MLVPAAILLPYSPMVRERIKSVEKKITVRLETLVSVLNGIAGNPNPDDPNEPHGPGGPVIRTAAGLVAARVVRTVVGVQQMAKAMPRGETQQSVERAGYSMLSEFTDDFCGTPPRIHWPWPWPDPDPWPWGPQPDPWRFGPQPEPWRAEIARLMKEPQGYDQVSAGLVFVNAASMLEQGELKDSLASAGAQLIETGLQAR